MEANRALEEKVYRSTEHAELSVTEVEMWKRAFIKEQQKGERAEQEARALRKRMAVLQESKVGMESIILPPSTILTV